MNAKQEAASAFLSQSSLGWTEEMFGSQIVDRDRLIDLLVEYRGGTANSALDSDKKQPQPAKPSKYVRLTYNPGTESSKRKNVSIWARLSTACETAINQVCFEVCDEAGTPLKRYVRLTQNNFETSVAVLRGNKLEVNE